MNKSVQLAMSGFQGSMNTGSTKIPLNHIGKKGKTWSFVSSNHDGTGQFQCRQNGEIQTFKMKFKEPLGRKAKLHFFGSEAA